MPSPSQSVLCYNGQHELCMLEHCACECHEAQRIAEEEAAAKKEQSMPIPNAYPFMQDYVIKDIELRKEIGIAKYGTLLQPHNGRDFLRDAYEEAMDLAIYLRGCLFERDGK